MTQYTMQPVNDHVPYLVLHTSKLIGPSTDPIRDAIGVNESPFYITRRAPSINTTGNKLEFRSTANCYNESVLHSERKGQGSVAIDYSQVRLYCHHYSNTQWYFLKINVIHIDQLGYLIISGGSRTLLREPRLSPPLKWGSGGVTHGKCLNFHSQQMSFKGILYRKTIVFK